MTIGYISLIFIITNINSVWPRSGDGGGQDGGGGAGGSKAGMRSAVTEVGRVGRAVVEPGRDDGGVARTAMAMAKPGWGRW